MTKVDLVEQVHSSCPKTTSTEVLEALEAALATMKAHLAMGESVKLSGFGVFIAADKRARRGRNPQTGKNIVIGAHRVVKFKPSPVLTGAMNRR